MNKTRGKEAEVRAHLEQAPRYSNQSMGAVGAAQRTLKGDFLTMRSDLEEKVNMKFNPAMNVWPWMVRHAAWTRARFGLKANMRTAYEDAFGGQYTGQILPFGEVLLFKIPHGSSGRKAGGRILKGDSVWERPRQNERDRRVLGRKHSVRTVRRLGKDEMELRSNYGIPWGTMEQRDHNWKTQEANSNNS